MIDYKKMEISDILYNSNLAGRNVEISGIARGVIDENSLLGIITPIGRKNYRCFLQQENNILLLSGSCDAVMPSMTEISMLKASSETGMPVTVRGTLSKAKLSSDSIDSNNNAKIPYKLKVDGVEFGGYQTICYNL